jgi:hypothetical protein
MHAASNKLHDNVCDNAACMRLARGRFFFIYEFINSIRLHASILTGGVLLRPAFFLGKSTRKNINFKNM